MVDYYNQRVSNQGIPPEEMQAKCVDITKDASPQFDKCVQAFHHFPDPQKTTNALFDLLKPDKGVLFVADLFTYDHNTFKQHFQRPGHGHGHSHGHGHDQAHSHSHGDGHGHGHSHGQESVDDQHVPFDGPAVVRRGGFSREDIEPIFTNAKLVDFKFIQPAATIYSQSGSKSVDLFLAVGRHP
ncbi:hypothetical protein CPB86DRAFT_780740 [Serendipita vermifera]|nr:hypothetical protein CPB86DRAFT_780740 [Serendipita vermifera]